MSCFSLLPADAVQECLDWVEKKIGTDLARRPGYQGTQLLRETWANGYLAGKQDVLEMENNSSIDD
jgi:hypothetical protein